MKTNKIFFFIGIITLFLSASFYKFMNLSLLGEWGNVASIKRSVGQYASAILQSKPFT